MTKSNERKLKVTAASGYKYQLVPQIQLKGIWLRQFGCIFRPRRPVFTVD